MNNYNTDMSILNLTHADLDGICSNIALYHFFPKIHRISYGYGKFDRFAGDIEALQKRGKHFDAMIITDINFTIDQFRAVEEAFKRCFTSNILYLDHHTSNREEMHSPMENRYVITDVSGARLTLNFFEMAFKYKSPEPLRNLITLADDYDRYVKAYPESEYLNYLFSHYRDSKFFNRFVNGYTGFTEEEQYMLWIWRNKLEVEYREVVNTPDNVVFITPDSIAFEYLGEHQNDITDLIFKYHSNIKSLIVKTNFGYSVRTTSKTTNIGIVLKYLNCGGGHPQAGGLKFHKDPTELPILLEVLKDIIGCIDSYGEVGEMNDILLDEFFGYRAKFLQLGIINDLRIVAK